MMLNVQSDFPADFATPLLTRPQEMLIRKRKLGDQ
jgi:hypothetical protein